jgi:hypothetical protein
MTVMPMDPHGPPQGSRTRSLAGAVVSTVPLVLLPFAVNVASDNLPGGAQRWAWLSWPAIVILVALSWRLGAAPGAPAPGAPNPPGAPGPTHSPSAPAGPASVPSAPPDSGPGFGAPPRSAYAPDPAARPFPWPPRADFPAPRPVPAGRPHGGHPPGAAPYGPVPGPPVAPRPPRWPAVPIAAAFTGVLVSQFHLIGVHAPFLATVLIVVIAAVLCLAEVISRRPVPPGTAAGLTYIVVAAMAVWRWDSSAADLWFVAESGVLLGLGVFLATRVREPRPLRRVLPGVVLALLGWCAMGVLFAIYRGEETAVANAAFFAGLATVVAGAIATALRAVADRDV